MKYLIKLDRISAWVLFIGLILYFISGYGMSKGIFDISLATKIHVTLLTYIVLVAFIIHSSFAIHLALKRWKIWNLYTKIILILFYIISIVLFVWVDLFYSKSKVIENNATILNMEELSKHTNSNDCWLLIDNKIYDVTEYLKLNHPSGPETILPYCGKDSNYGWDNKKPGRPHSNFALDLLENYYIGDFNTVLK